MFGDGVLVRLGGWCGRPRKPRLVDDDHADNGLLPAAAAATLPDEVLAAVLSRLDCLRDVLQADAVCRRWRDAHAPLQGRVRLLCSGSRLRSQRRWLHRNADRLQYLDLDMVSWWHHPLHGHAHTSISCSCSSSHPQTKRVHASPAPPPPLPQSPRAPLSSSRARAAAIVCRRRKPLPDERLPTNPHALWLLAALGQRAASLTSLHLCGGGLTLGAAPASTFDGAALTQLSELTISSSGAATLPESLGRLPALQRLALLNCSHLRQLPSTIADAAGLRELVIVGCSRLSDLHHGLPGGLTRLVLTGCSELQVSSGPGGCGVVVGGVGGGYGGVGATAAATVNNSVIGPFWTGADYGVWRLPA
jgi:F-box-like